MSAEAAPEFQSVRETAARAGVSEDLIHDAIERGEIEGVKQLGRRKLIPRDALDRLPLAMQKGEFDTVTSADGAYRCLDPACRAHHQPQPFSVELRVRSKTQRVGAHGPVTVKSSERLPYELPSQCPQCGGEVEIIKAPTTSGTHGRDAGLRWPQPRVPAAFSGEVSEQLEPPTPELSPEERVAKLEKRLAALEAAAGVT